MKTKEFYFKELLNYLTIKVDKVKYPGYIFYFKNDKCYFQYNTKNDIFYVNNNRVWEVFEKKYYVEYDEIRQSIKNMVEDYFKLKDVIPIAGFKMIFSLVEEHFNKK